MTFKVFHANSLPSGNIAGRFGMDATVFPTHFTHVATVEAEALGHVFQLTNHIDRPFTENPEVTVVVNKPLRSTSVGDVIQAPDKSLHVVAPMGFNDLSKIARLRYDSVEDKFTFDVPALYSL